MTTGCEPLVGFEAAAGAFFVVVESRLEGPSLSLVAVWVTFRVAAFFTGAGGPLGFIAAVRVVRVATAGVGSAGVVVFERVALVVIVAGFGKREVILCTRLERFRVAACQSRRDACQITFCLFRDCATACALVIEH
jgi:hypothetical protein